MLETLRNAWKVVDLRKKILFTLFIIVVFRIGSVVPVPFIDVATLSSAKGAAHDFFNVISTLGGGALTYGTIFALGVSPYINSSIIMQLLSVAIPALERLAQEGEEGKKKIAKYTRIATVALALLQGTGYFFYLLNGKFLTAGTNAIFAGFVIVLCLTAGSTLVMWLGEQIDSKGIGNGISMLLFTGIIAQADEAFATLYSYWARGEYVTAIAIVLAFLLVIAFIVWMTDAERRIPVQYAKKVVGRKMYGGQSTHIPIKVNMSGVMPIIFASSILMVPTMLLSFMQNKEGTFAYKFLDLFSANNGIFYALIYFAMIIAFAYFYVTIQYNPVEMANNLRQNSGAIPGIRPGNPTSDFIKKILSRVTLLGALFLSVIAVVPILVSIATNINISLGGTSVIILVGVALETVKNLETQMLMRHYKGFLE